MAKVSKALKKAVRRFNTNLNQLIKHLGMGSTIVNDIRTKLDVLSGNDLDVIKGDFEGLTNLSKIASDKDLRNMVYKMEKSMPRWGDLKRRYQLEYRMYQRGDSAGFPEKSLTLEQFINVSSKLNNLIEWMYENGSKELNDEVLEILRGDENGNRGFMLDYGTLNHVTNMINEEFL